MLRVNYIFYLFSFVMLPLSKGFSQQFNLVGSATQLSCECFQLTDNLAWEGGSVWNLNQIDLNNPFDYNFRVYLGCNDTQGADGICFVLQNTSVNVGGNGGGLGYMNFPNQSIGIEIDTYENVNYGDIASDHIGINSNGAINHNLAAPVQASVSSMNIEDCAWHYFRVVWNPASNNMQIYFDQVLRINHTFTGGLINNIFNGNANVFWGFTGATGLLYNLQQVCLNIQASFSAGNNYISCTADSVQFYNNSQTGLNNIVAYFWDFGDGTTSTIQNPLHSFPGPGVYNVTLTITDQSLCNQSINQLVTIYESPVVNVSTQPIYCGIGNGTANAVINLGTAPYNVSVNYANAIVSSLNQNTFDINNLVAGNYVININDANNCSISQEFIITETAPPVVNIVVIDAGCNGSSTGSITINTLNAVLPLSYAINNQPQQTNNTFNNLSAGNYTIVITDANACSTIHSTTVNNTQVILDSIASFGICSNQDTSILAIASGGSENFTYTFTNLNTGQTYQTNPLLIDPETDAMYSVIATDDEGCNSNVEQFMVTVNQSPEIDFLADLTSGCKPLCVTFTAFSNQSNCTYQWLTGDQTSFTTQNVFHCYQETGLFDVLLKVTSQNGCSSLLLKEKLINVEDLPLAFFSITPKEIYLDDAIVYLSDYTDTSLYHISWSFGDNSPRIKGYANTYTFKDTGLYCITLTASNNVGCTDSVTKCIKVNEQPTLYIPNSFTPNGDFLNDEFFARGTGIDQMSMFIYNRWGEEIFKATNMTEIIRWDGNNAPQGVYHYLMDIKFTNKKLKTYTGAIRLIR